MSRHNGNPHDEVFVDKYATSATNLDATPNKFRSRAEVVEAQTEGLEGFASKS